MIKIKLHPESRTSTIEAPKGAVGEVVSRRRASQKCWQMPDGKQVVYCWNKYAPVHYKDNYDSQLAEKQAWKEIDPTYYEDKGSHLLFNLMPHTVKIYKDRYGYEITDRRTMKTMSVELLEIDDEPISLSSKMANVAFEAEVRHDGVRFWKKTFDGGPTKFKWEVKESGAESRLKFREAPEAFDQEQKEVTVSVTKEATKDGFIWTEQVDKTGVKIDTDVTSESNDGRIYGQSSSYATARSTSTTTDATDLEATFLGQYRDGFMTYTYTVMRLFLDFDTSAISNVSQVNLKLTAGYTGYTETDFDVEIVKQNWSEPLDDSRESNYDGCLSGTEDDSIWRNTAGINTNVAYTSGNLDTSHVNTSGDTKYSLRSSRDSGNITPGYSGERIQMWLSDALTASRRPVLVITTTSIGWTGKIWGVENPASIWGIDVANIAKVHGL